MNSSRYKKEQLKYLAHLLASTPEEIEYLCENIGSYYRKWVEQKIDKKTGKPKIYPDGTVKQRTIRPSKYRLKILQKKIKKLVLDPVKLPDNVQGGVKGKNNILNAKRHQGKKYIFCTDLQEFFPDIKYRQIHDMFLKLDYSHHVAHWLTKLTSIEFELPQGTPTSTAIANIIFLQTDYKLIEICKENGITYTRFVDDLTFSSPSDFQDSIPVIIDTLLSGGFKISRRKTSYEGKQTITGIRVHNNFIDLPDKIKEKVKEEKLSNPKAKPYAGYLSRVVETNVKGYMKKQEARSKATHDKN